LNSTKRIIDEEIIDRIEFVSHEWIYQYIWKDKKQGGILYTHLRNQSKRYRKRGAAKDNRGQIRNKTPLSQRPELVEKRERIGDQEIDLVIGRAHNGAILTINDRASGLLIMELLLGKNAADVKVATISRLDPYKEYLHTITSDNGKEFAGHEEIAAALGIDFYFAKPYHNWERGSNENLNGLIRQYIPKNNNILELDKTYIAEVEKALNDRPRKRYGYKLPSTIFQQLTKMKKVALAS
jgi:transposase, IS30 family